MPPSSSLSSQDPLGEDGGRDGRRRKRRKKTRANRSSVPKRRKEARTEEDGGGANRRGFEEAASAASNGGVDRRVAATGNGENMEILGAGGTEASASTVLFPKGGTCRNDFFCTYIFFSLNLDGRVRPRPPGTLAAAAEEGNWPAEKEARPPMLAKQ